MLDYVAAHEVAHIAELNHSPRVLGGGGAAGADYAGPRDWLRRERRQPPPDRLRHAGGLTGRAPPAMGPMNERERQSETTLPAHERVYRVLRSRVMHGQIAPGVR